MTARARTDYLADHARVAATLPGAKLPWLATLRREALDAFAERGLPTRHDEAWKYTSVAEFERHALLATPAGAQLCPEAHALFERFSLDKKAAHLLVFHNGHFSPELSSPGTLPEGITLMSLAQALSANPESIKPWIGRKNQAPAFDALNTAFMADGAYLHLKKEAKLETPVHLMFISTDSGGASYLRNLIVAEPGAQATVIEHYVGQDNAVYFTNAVTHIFAAENASVEHHKLQQEANSAFHVAGIHAVQQRDSRLSSHSFTVGGALTRNDITTVFDGSACQATLNGLYLIGGQQHVDNHTCIDHSHANGTSREHYRGVLEGQSHAVFNGKIVVRPGAQKTNASQSNHNLLLSRQAEIDTQPQLEIYADDVKCAHGATVGQLDEAQLFYLRSRGVEEALARRLLVHAFAHDVIEPIRVAALQSRLESLLLAHLPHTELSGEKS